MNILFIGGTGVISQACTQACLERGDKVFLLNRGESPQNVTTFRLISSKSNT
jgi:NAD dependent epimerase/dehydratase family enzyme